MMNCNLSTVGSVSGDSEPTGKETPEGDAAAEPVDGGAAPSAFLSDSDDDEAAAERLEAAQRKVDRMLVGPASLVNDLPRCAP